MPLGSRRAIVWVVSITASILLSLGTVAVFNTTFEKYGVINMFVLGVGYFGVLWVWLDYFLKTDMLPH